MSTGANDVYADNLERYEELVAGNPDVERKGATMPYTSRNGHMFSFLTKEGRLALRLPKEEREQFLKAYGTQLVVQYGRVMKEYVQVPDARLSDTEQLVDYFEISHAYVGSLKPKPTKRDS